MTAHRTRAEPLRVTALRSLRDDGPQTSMQLTLRLDPYPGTDVTQSRNGLNQRLAALRRDGLARVAGTTPAAYHNTPSFVWEITPAGQAYLDNYRVRAEERRLAATRKEDALRWLIREAMAHRWGPGTPVAERRQIARALRGEGILLDWIAAVFDVTRECIRLDCAGLVTRGGGRVQVEPAVLPAKGPGFAQARTRARAG
jgi:hypothetical protein